MAEVLGKILVL